MYPTHIYKIAEELHTRYKDFNHYNRGNPLDELLFIICSVKTSQPNYLRTYKELRKQFPQNSALTRATIEELSNAIAIGGLSNQKARLIRRQLDQIIDKFGKLTLAPLKKMNDEECENFLLSLHGVGKKVARCVMMYSLKRKVFPVDTHICRIASRLGWGQPSRSDNACSQKDMDELQSLVPPNLRYSLHVNMVSLGREICLPRNPICEKCPILTFCPQIGVK
jgi:endonuclease III